MGLLTTITTTGSVLTPDDDQIEYSPPVICNQNTVGQTYQLALSAGPTTVNLPSNTAFIGLRMPQNNSVLVTLKGVSGDTGIAVHKLYGLPCFAVDSSVTSIVLVAAAAVTVQLTSG
jgi:hypothetical protein